MAEEIHLVIAKNLKDIRDRKKLSLDKVSELTGVSKTMIGQIERGESSPTITTIWKIATGLKVSFTSLIHEPQPETKIVLRDEINVLSEDDGKYRVYPCFPYHEDQRFELYFIEIEPGGYHHADPHIEGTEEYITVFDGEMTIEVNQSKFTIKRGDSIRFKADRSHSYRNTGDSLVRASMTIYYPETQ